MNSLIWQDIDATREITSYGCYLAAGAVTGAHLPAVRSWVWRHRRAVGLGALAVTAGAEGYYVLTVRAGLSPGAASDPFSPEYIPSYLAAVALLWLAGAWWAARPHGGPAAGGRLSGLIRTTSDNSFGVYLSHVVFLDLLATCGLGSLERRVPWAVVVLIAVAATWAAASLFTAAMARTPVSRWVTGRVRRPLRGGPPATGRGSDDPVDVSRDFPDRPPRAFRLPQQLEGRGRASSQHRPACWPEWFSIRARRDP